MRRLLFLLLNSKTNALILEMHSDAHVPRDYCSQFQFGEVVLQVLDLQDPPAEFLYHLRWTYGSGPKATETVIAPVGGLRGGRKETIPCVDCDGGRAIRKLQGESESKGECGKGGLRERDFGRGEGGSDADVGLEIMIIRRCFGPRWREHGRRHHYSFLEDSAI